MKTEILHLLEGASKAKGLTVIIDVFRAYSLACYIFARGAQKIIPVGEVSEAFELKGKYPSSLLAGERDNRKVPGFDFGNSPFEILKADLGGKTIIHTTSAGTQGMVNAVNSTDVITGSFVNAQAIVDYILRSKPEYVSLVCMGYSAKYPVEEDTFCAGYIKTKLEGGEPDFPAMTEIIRATSGRRFFKPDAQEYCPKEDFDLCLALDAFDFVIKKVHDADFGSALVKQGV
jgi:2-phosphosulfolactate phosphatase